MVGRSRLPWQARSSDHCRSRNVGSVSQSSLYFERPRSRARPCRENRVPTGGRSACSNERGYARAICFASLSAAARHIICRYPFLMIDLTSVQSDFFKSARTQTANRSFRLRRHALVGRCRGKFFRLGIRDQVCLRRSNSLGTLTPRRLSERQSLRSSDVRRNGDHASRDA